MTFLTIIGCGRDKIYKNNIFRGVRIVAVILCTTGIALLAYMDGVDPKEGVRYIIKILLMLTMAKSATMMLGGNGEEMSS